MRRRFQWLLGLLLLLSLGNLFAGPGFSWSWWDVPCFVGVAWLRLRCGRMPYVYHYYTKSEEDLKMKPQREGVLSLMRKAATCADTTQLRFLAPLQSLEGMNWTARAARYHHVGEEAHVRGEEGGPTCARKHFLTAITQVDAMAGHLGDLKEWLDFHTLVGVDYFVVLSYRDPPGLQEIVAPYVARGAVDLVKVDESTLKGKNLGPTHGPQTFSTLFIDNTSWAANKSRQLLRDTFWVAFLDHDEFFTPPHWSMSLLDTLVPITPCGQPTPVGQLLVQYTGFFGPNGNVRRPRGHAIEAYTTRRSYECCNGKSIGLADAINPIWHNPHAFKLKEGRRGFSWMFTWWGTTFIGTFPHTIVRAPATSKLEWHAVA
uniref:Glycosyltransferase family 92 protein n=1 Tax=Alexandrium monilatum TaxID=311494 RepID=A0A7S4S9R0_9DINO